MFDKQELKKFPYLFQEWNKRRQLNNPREYSPNELYNYGKLEDKLSKEETERIDRILTELVYDLTPIENLFIIMSKIEYKTNIDFPIDIWREFHEADLLNLFSKKGLYMEFISMDIKVIVYLAEHKLLVDEDLQMVKNELITYLSSNKRNSYYKFILKLASEPVLSVCKDRKKFIDLLLKFGIRKTFMAYAKQQFVHMDLADDFLKAMMEMLLRRSKDLTFFEMISIFFAIGKYRIEYLKKLHKKIKKENIYFILAQIINKCRNDIRNEKILEEELTQNEIKDLYNLLIKVSENIYSYKDLYALSDGKIKEQIAASILLYDMKNT